MADGDSGRSVGLADVLSRFIQEMIHLVPRPLNPDTSTEMMQHIRDTLRALYTDVFRFLTEPDDSPLLPIGSASDEITIRIRGLKFLMTGFFEVLYERIRHCTSTNEEMNVAFNRFILLLTAELIILLETLRMRVPWPAQLVDQYDLLNTYMGRVLALQGQELQANDIPNEADDRMNYLRTCLRAIKLLLIMEEPTTSSVAPSHESTSEESSSPSTEKEGAGALAENPDAGPSGESRDLTVPPKRKQKVPVAEDPGAGPSREPTDSIAVPPKSKKTKKSGDDDDLEMKCVVCWGPIEDMASAWQFPCTHVVHKKCLDLECAAEDRICPSCGRRDFKEQ